VGCLEAANGVANAGFACERIGKAPSLSGVLGTADQFPGATADDDKHREERESEVVGLTEIVSNGLPDFTRGVLPDGVIDVVWADD
jgi:hypothetical protein